jgi:methionine sulfoxide reductase heme-binding subunit
MALLWFVCLLPVLVGGYFVFYTGVGPDPGEWLVEYFGLWAMRLLLLTLAVTPLRELFKFRLLVPLRRVLGLSCFFYACLHLTAYSHFYLGWSLSGLLEEVIERPYISLGFAAWCCLLPMAITSRRALMKRMGKNWKLLHRLIYLVAVLVCVHFLWQSRSDFGEPLVYIVLFASLLIWRLYRVRRRTGFEKPTPKATAS